jgi:undecaprenyl diphosphate synthase
MKKLETIGVIMDGNRRWAKLHNLPTTQGHASGYSTLKDMLHWARESGVHNVVAYAFSDENWKRSKEEVDFLLSLMTKVIEEEFTYFIEQKVRVVFAGSLEKFPGGLRASMKKLEDATKEFTDFNLVLAVSYGGRSEIVSACNRCLAEGKESLTEKDISSHLYTAHIPDPDLIIRTSGEMRLSGFLLWQVAYSELFFTQTLWPDFSKEEFLSIIEEYHSRERRLGI